MKNNLTPDQLGKEKNWNLEIKYVVAFIIISSIIIVSRNTTNSSSENKTLNRGKSNNEFSNGVSKIIPGLAPVDVYLSMEKEGFVTEKTFSSEYGNTWISKSKVEGMDFHVSVFSMGSDNVESVKATAIIDPSQRDILDTQSFIMYVASLPFDGAEPDQTIKWVKDNFNNDKASKLVGNVKFTIYAPTKILRMLIVEKV